MAQVTLNVNGRPYVVGCEDGQEPHLAELAKRFDRHVRQVSQEMGQLGETRLSFASEERLMAMLGLTPGSVTPFALADDREQRITVLLDDGIRQDDLVGFHPLVNSQTLCIRYADLLRYLAHTGHTPVRVTL